jgi:CDP-L-myo-inositol myo-inositolphosphotransferase
VLESFRRRGKFWRELLEPCGEVPDPYATGTAALEMKGVILAAGKGKRFGSDKPKVLAKLLNKSLLEHAVAGLKRAGIREEDIVVVYSDARVKESLLHLGVKFVYNKAVNRGNGYSLLKAKGHVKGDKFILLMGDHFFEAGSIESIIPSDDGLQSNGVIRLAVERNLHGRNVGEATKVLLRGKFVEDIGKDIRRFNALDTGLFMCSPHVFEIAESFKDPFSVNDVMKKAADEGLLSFRDITGSMWTDVDTREDLKQAEKKILQGLIKKTDGIVSRHINRKVSTRLTRLFLRTWVSPNQVSLFSFLLALASGMMFFLSHSFAGGIIAQVSSIFDGCDGELSRLRGTPSKFGAYYDSLLDRYADFAILLGMIMVNPVEHWVPGAFAILGSYSISYSSSRAEQLTGKGFTRGLSSLMTRDIRLFLVMLGGVLDHVLLTLYILAITTNLVVFSRLLTIEFRIKEKHPEY